MRCGSKGSISKRDTVTAAKILIMLRWQPGAPGRGDVVQAEPRSCSRLSMATLPGMGEGDLETQKSCEAFWALILMRGARRGCWAWVGWLRLPRGMGWVWVGLCSGRAILCSLVSEVQRPQEPGDSKDWHLVSEKFLLSWFPCTWDAVPSLTWPTLLRSLSQEGCLGSPACRSAPSSSLAPSLIRYLPHLCHLSLRPIIYIAVCRPLGLILSSLRLGTVSFPAIFPV